jgi:tetratricopeptide (TPR) repeat protein
VKRKVLASGLVVVSLLIVGGIVWHRAHPSSSEPLAKVRAELGTRTATRSLEQLRQKSPDNAEVQFLSASQARLEGRAEAAAAHLKRASELGWSSWQIERERLFILALFDFRRARPGLEDLLASDPHDSEALLAMANGELRAGRPERAAELADRVLGLMPTDAQALHLRGAARLQGRRLDLARADLEAALAAGPDSVAYAPARITLATCLLDLGEFDHALELFRAARTDDPSNLLALFGAGRAASYRGHLEEAEEAFRAVLVLRPGHVETLLALAQIAEQRGDLPKALEYLEDAEKGDPNRLETHARLAKLLAALGQSERAEAHEARYRALDPTRQPPATKPGESP